MAHRPAHHRPGIQIQNHYQVQPAFPGGNKRDVPGPLRIGPRDHKLLVQQIRRRFRLARIRRHAELGYRLGYDAAPAHQ